MLNIPNICLYIKYIQVLTLILVLLPASSTRTDACFFLLDVNFPLLCDPDLTGSGDPAMVTFLPLKTKIRVIKFAPFSNRLISNGHSIYIDAQQRYLARGLDLDSFPFVSVRSTDKSLVPFCAAECVGDCNAK